MSLTIVLRPSKRSFDLIELNWKLFVLSLAVIKHILAGKGGGGGGLGGRDTPLMPFYLYHLETAQAIKLTLSEFEDTLIRF